jgi:MFS transporter, DHA2 family, multidrug resistance protein
MNPALATSRGSLPAGKETTIGNDGGSGSSAPLDHQNWKPSVNPWLVAVSVMLATFMVVLDSSVANVALPHIAGNLSASTDESTWVLTSYLVSNAIMLPAAGWISRRIGRKRLLMISILVFTLASLLCGLSLNMPMLILARVLQGIGGGGMQPLAQSILLESFPPHQHGTAMAAYGMGIVVAPVIGPTLGGWITDSYSWRWIFYINLPIGLVALFLANLYIEDPPYLRKAIQGAIDYIGFGAMAIWLGTLQLVLDKGQEADWFEATWIRWTLAVSALALIGFVVREFTTREPIVQLRVLGDRSFAVGTVLTCIYGFTLYGVTALLPLFLQTVMGYPALDSGLAVSPRGFGSILSMLIVGILVNRIDARVLLGFGFALLAYSTYALSHINLDISMISVIWPNILNGFAGGFIFVPLTTMTMGQLRKEQIGNAAGIYNLMRNIGGSVGIASVTTMLVRGAQVHQNYLAAHLTSQDPDTLAAFQGLQAQLHAAGASIYDAGVESLGALYRSLEQQATVLSYADNFRFMTFLMILCVPLVLFFRRPRKHAGSTQEISAE